MRLAPESEGKERRSDVDTAATWVARALRAWWIVVEWRSFLKIAKVVWCWKRDV